MEDRLKKWEEKLHAKGHRITLPLREVMKVIISSPRPLTPMEIFDSARINIPQIGLVTIYRSIEKLEELGLVDHIHHINECQTVFPTSGPHKHLIICEKCGRSVYFEGLEIENEFQRIAKQAGYQLTSHWLQLSGVCNNCL